MIAIGVEIGHVTVKALMLTDSQVEDYEIIYNAAEKSSIVAEIAIKQLLQKSGATIDDIGSISCTGLGSKKLTFPNINMNEIACTAKGASQITCDSGIVIDVGAERTRVIKYDEKGNIINYVVNDRCAAGTGTFLENLASAMKINVNEMGSLSESSRENIEISNTCAVFAQSEVISFIHRGVYIPDIINAVHKSFSKQIFKLFIRVDPSDNIMMAGGVAKNKALVSAVQKQVGHEIFVPDEPQIVTVLGAAHYGLSRFKGNKL